MRVDVKKFIFIGPQNQREPFFAAAQKMGCIEFVMPRMEGQKELPSHIDDIAKALKVLRHYPILPKQENYSHLEVAQDIAEEILTLNADLHKAREDQRTLHQEIERIAIFGDFDKGTIHQLQQQARCTLQFFYTSRIDDPKIAQDETLIYIGEAHSLYYFVAINQEPRSYPKMVEIQIEEPVGTLRGRLQEMQALAHDCETALKQLTVYEAFLREYLIRRLNEYHLSHAEASVEELIDSRLFAIEGWAAVTYQEELDRLTKEFDVHCEEIIAYKTDRIPTQLENAKNALVGEDLVHIYDTPSIRDKDPSLWVLCAFAFFFSMIVGDGGYGAVLLGTVLFVRYKFGKQAAGLGKRMLKLGIILGTACVIWGFLTTSFFGLSIGVDNPIRSVSLVTWMAEKKADYHLLHHDDVYQQWVAKIPSLAAATTGKEFLQKGVTYVGDKAEHLVLGKFLDNIMLELALLVGTLHVILSFARYLDRNWSGLGWIMFMIGGYLFFPSLLNATSLTHFLFGGDKMSTASNGLFLVYSGIGMAMGIAILQRKILGLLEIQNLIQVFADILSYLRLYALGLAGAIMSSTFNGMAESAGWIAGFAIILMGHGINFALGMMGGLIHGLRLNFLEWYHYSFEGGGRMLKPLSLINSD